jgi:hypothetical protein
MIRQRTLVLAVTLMAGVLVAGGAIVIADTGPQFAASLGDVIYNPSQGDTVVDKDLLIHEIGDIVGASVTMIPGLDDAEDTIIAN